MPPPARNAECPCGSGKKYKLCCGRAQGKRPPLGAAHLDEALDYFGSGFVPDYAGFREWLEATRKEGVTRAGLRPFRAHDESERVALGLLERLEALREKFRSGEAPPGSEWGKLKLIIGALATSERFEAILNSRGEAIPPKTPLNTLSPAELRRQLFAAMQTKDDRLALRVLGALEAHPDAHDDGEVAYLAALYYFRSGDMAAVLDRVALVEANAIDFPAAQYLRLQAAAKLGRSDEVIATLDAVDPEELTLLLVWHLALLLNTAVEVSEDVHGRLQHFASFVGPFDAAQDPFARDFAYDLMGHCTEFLLRLQDARIWSGDQPTGWAPLLDAARQSDHRLDRLASGMSSVSVLEPLVAELEAGRSGWRPMKAALEWAQDSGADDSELFLRAFETLAALNEHELLASHYGQVMADADGTAALTPSQRDFVLLVMPSLVLVGADEETEKAREALKRSGVDVAAINRSAQDMQVAATLRGDGRLLCLAECRRLREHLDADSRWEDAGLVALGFFRLLEMEMNRRLIVPLVARLSQRELDSAASSLGTGLAKTWAPVLSGLRGMLEGKKGGLELGPLEVLLGKVRRPEKGRDAALRQLIRAPLLEVLTDEGCDALDAGSLAKLVERDVREQFRNAGAHARLVSAATAAQSKEYVDEALLLLASWVGSEPSTEETAK